MVKRAKANETEDSKSTRVVASIERSECKVTSYEAAASDVPSSAKSGNKKRKRGTNIGEQTHSQEKTLHEEHTHRRNRPLAGKVLVVSTQTDGLAEHNYKTVCALCVDAGATITGQVHKKVLCVIATEEAAGYGPRSKPPTQRVRKAWKRQITVVGVKWVEDCIRLGQLLPLDHKYRWQEPQQKSESSSRNIASDKSPNDSVGATSPSDHEVVVTERKIDLGCCCSCHDDAVGIISSCEWCVDCSVNQALSMKPTPPS